MQLSPGSRVGPYEIIALLGTGSMGEVYRARDTKLGRDVALKVLSASFAHDAERMARFEREAHVLASLNHPHIAAIYGFEDSGGVRALVMELAEGPTLANRIAAGPIPIEPALGVARQIAEALEYAHEKGVVHRDLKPSNVKVGPGGSVKILDFGLAKAMEERAPEGDVTLTLEGTRIGVILGTAAYMSPEQARGLAVDKRADIWAFGALLCEMLTGKKAFAGRTKSDILASVLKTAPDWTELPAATPPAMRALLGRCLEKDARRRLRDIGEARIALEDFLEGRAPASSAPPAVGRRPALPWVVAALLAVALAGALVALWRAGARAEKPVLRFHVAVPAGALPDLSVNPALAVSPDGKRLIYTATGRGASQLFLRSLDRFDSAPLPATEGGRDPFFSPDGEWVGFFAGHKLKRLSLKGRPVDAVTEISGDPRGACWSKGDFIIFTQSPSAPLYRLPASGGAPQAVSKLDPSKQERTHRWPQALPSGKAVLFTVGAQDSPDYYENARIDAVILATGERRVLLEGASMARYVASGHLVFARAGSLYAVPFDQQRLAVTGSPVLVLEGVEGDPTTGAAHFAVSDDGLLVFVPGEQANRHLAWLDQKGEAELLAVPPRPYLEFALSPDGRQVAVVISSGKDHDIWLYDLGREALTRLTFGGRNRSPAWSPDGRQIAFVRTTADGKSEVFLKPGDGSGQAEMITTVEARVFVDSWSPDGKLLTLYLLGASDILLLPVERGTKPRPLLVTEFHEWHSRLSPGGRWLAYQSNESGRAEVYVQAFPGPGGKWQISAEGGEEPCWSRDGRELYYRSGVRLMKVSVDTVPVFKPGATRMLFQGLPYRRTDVGGTFEPAPDGRRFLAAVPAQKPMASGQILIVANWFEELRRQVPQGRP